jgi:hypothetical protein
MRTTAGAPAPPRDRQNDSTGRAKAPKLAEGKKWFLSPSLHATDGPAAQTQMSWSQFQWHDVRSALPLTAWCQIPALAPRVYGTSQFGRAPSRSGHTHSKQQMLRNGHPVLLFLPVMPTLLDSSPARQPGAVAVVCLGNDRTLQAAGHTTPMALRGGKRVSSWDCLRASQQ